MWGLRKQVSLLLSEGHTQAQFYPVRRVWEETEIAVERINGMLGTEALLTHEAVSAVIDKRANSRFKKRVKDLSGG